MTFFVCPSGDVPTEEKTSGMIQVGFKGGALKKHGAYSKILHNNNNNNNNNGNPTRSQTAEALGQPRRAQQYFMVEEEEKHTTDSARIAGTLNWRESSARSR